MILRNKKRWLITGVAGFIGSNLLETLLVHNQKVVGIDNFVTGSKKNLELIKKKIGPNKWNNFKFIRGNIEHEEICKQGCKNIDFVLHQAAIGSVPRSIKDPITTNKSNVTGFLNLITAAKNAKVEKFIYASSSSVYGDNLNLPKIEKQIGNALSPYAFTKQINENYARIFSKLYGLKCVGLRYFNVFGKYQNPNGDYAAVIPRWILNMINNKRVKIFGDGNTTRDFCFIENVVQANISAATRYKSLNEVYNVANGNQISLNDLFYEINKNLKENGIIYDKKPEYLPFRSGDIRYSLANINKIKKNLKYKPLYNFKSGIKKLIPWYIESKNFYKTNND
tara:strand:- start:264 stop:1277 length:1014 start_codon:yes stop_codon:yes gene_type:complete